MFKVNNRQTINQLSKSALKSNRLRNLFAVIAIILTTVLFTTFFTIGFGLIDSMEQSVMRQVGSNFHSGYKSITTEQYEQLKEHKLIKDISYSVILGMAENEALVKRPTEIRYTHDAMNAKGMFSMPTTGRLPQSDDELATDTLVLEKLGIPAELGQNVTLEYSVQGEKYSETFVLVGFWEGDSLMKASQLWLNRSYVEGILKDYDRTQPNDVIGKINAIVNFSNDYNIKNKTMRTITESGYTTNEIAYGINWAYVGGMTDFNYMPILVIILILGFCGYLMISNVFFISIAKDVRYFGLLKTIGTTSKQIKKIILNQTLILCLVGIPVGLFIGYFVGIILVPKVLSTLNVNVISHAINPYIFGLAAIFSGLTVYISILKPVKIASRISPIEAIRKSDGQASKKIKKTKRNHSVRVYELAKSNAFRNKRKMILVVVSLSLSLILLNATFSLSMSFNMDKFISDMIQNDFIIGDVANFNVHVEYDQQDTVNDAFMRELIKQSGIDRYSNVYFSEAYLETDPQLNQVEEKIKNALGNSNEQLQDIRIQLSQSYQPVHIYGLDTESFSQLTLLSGSLDYEKLNTGKYVVVGPHDDEGIVSYYEIGDKVILPNDQGEPFEYEVIGIATIPYALSIKHWHPITPTFYLPSSTFSAQIANKAPLLMTLDVAEGYETMVESFLKKYSENIDTNMAYQSKASIAEEYRNTMKTYKTVGLTLSFILALIGIMNFMNTVITSINARRLELAMLQSVGMTTHQTRSLLVMESMLIIVLTYLVTLIVGSALSIMFLKSVVSDSSFLIFDYTVLPSLVSAPILLLIGTTISLLSQKYVYKTSTVERLRELE